MMTTSTCKLLLHRHAMQLLVPCAFSSHELQPAGTWTCLYHFPRHCFRFMAICTSFSSSGLACNAGYLFCYCSRSAPAWRGELCAQPVQPQHLAEEGPSHGCCSVFRTYIQKLVHAPSACLEFKSNNLYSTNLRIKVANTSNKTGKHFVLLQKTCTTYFRLLVFVTHRCVLTHRNLICTCMYMTCMCMYVQTATRCL